MLLKPFNEMTREDYTRLGLKVGLEIHQQLYTEKKLFCRCPAGKYDITYDAEILRHMRPTLSELGEYDGTALMEFKTKKEIIYQINHETVCTYEMDDTPPFEINPEALDNALEIAMLMNYKLVSEIHIARKQYLDGSIPTGFQRTTIVGIDGWIPYKDKKIGLIQLGLEEDSCREVSDIGHNRVYRSDRLGMPLIETVTEPAMHTPQEAAEVCEILRQLVRSTGKVRTGIGAGRQDVNVSITGGTRIEIKGVHKIPHIPRLVYNEALRQHSLLEIRKELHKRGITEETFKTETAEVTHLLKTTNWEPIRQALNREEKVFCVNLRGFNGILSFPTQTGRVFSKEISDRVRVISCLTRLPNILTSESTEETIDSFAGNRIRKAVKATSQDALVLVWATDKDMETAINEIIIRAKEATIGIPSETRQALPDGTNGFERILPGADRMYPDTDLPPLEITNKRIEKLSHNVPPPMWERIATYKNLGVPEHLRVKIAATPRANLFDKLCETQNLSATWIARYMFENFVFWRRKKLAVQKITEADWQYFFTQAEKHPALLEKGLKIFEDYLMSDSNSISEHLEEFLPAKYNPENMTEIILSILKKDDTPLDEEKRGRFLFGQIMEVLRGHVPAEIVKESFDGHYPQNGGKNE